MHKIKLPHAYLNILKAAVLCGVALQPLQSAHAGWNSEIAEMDAIGETGLRVLKARCSSEVKTLLSTKDVDKNSEAFIAKKAKWNARGTRVMNLMNITHSDKTITVEERKHYLFDKDDYKTVLLQKNPSIREIKGNQQASELDTHAMSIFEAKNKVVKVTQEEATPEYLRKMLAGSGLDADEQERQLKAALAEMKKTPVVEEKTKKISSEDGLSLKGPILPSNVTLKSTNTIAKVEEKTNSNNTTPKATTTEQKIKIVEEKTTNNNNNSPSLSQIQKEIENYQSFLSILGDSSEDKRQKSIIQVKLNKLELLHQNGVKSYTSDEDLNKTFEELSKNDLQAKTTNNTTPKFVEEKTNVISNGPSAVEKEIKELTDALALFGDTLEDKRSKGQIQAKLSKLENAHKAGVTSYKDEHELDYYMMPTTTTVTRLVEPVVTKPLFNIAKEISELEANLSFITQYGSTKDKEFANTRLEKLKNAQNLGVEAYTEENDLDAYLTLAPVKTNTTFAPVNTNNTTPQFNVAKEISELEANMEMIEQYASFTEKKEARARLGKLKAAQNRGITTYANEQELG